ncbi:von Willebrand factor C and EGF domain-containing protein [Nymphon striatum]|nr:von Willebrand factor C and EGF domain-containing protein [Nymphon striatum]
MFTASFKSVFKSINRNSRGIQIYGDKQTHLRLADVLPRMAIRSLIVVILLYEKISIHPVTSIKSQSGPHICRSRTGTQPCCPGWEHRDQDQLCLTPICTNGCGKYGICVSPNVCQCQDGIIAPVCLNSLSESQTLCNDYDCHQKCDMQSGYPSCSCFIGFQLHEDLKTCVDINECEINKEICNKNLCLNTIGSYKCSCDGTASKDGRKCAITADQSTQLRSKIALKSYSTDFSDLVDHEIKQPQLCPHGYMYNRVLGFCNDVNECRIRRRLECDHICVNTPGSYSCSCYLGYSLQPDKHSCKRKKINIELCIPQCTNSGTCINGNCLCKAGLHGKACEKDVNECLELEDVYHAEVRILIAYFIKLAVLKECFEICYFLATAMSCVPECVNGGNCIDGKCSCPAGFKGKSCGMDTHIPESAVDMTRKNVDSSQCDPPCKPGYSCTSRTCKCVTPGECSTVSPSISFGLMTAYPKIIQENIEHSSNVGSLQTAPSTQPPISISFHETSRIFTTTQPSLHLSSNEKKLNSKNVSVSVNGEELDMRKVSSKIFKDLEDMRNSNKNLSSLHMKQESKSGFTHYKKPSDEFVLAVNKNIMKSMMNDLKSRRRAINENGKGTLNSGVLVSASSVVFVIDLNYGISQYYINGYYHYSIDVSSLKSLLSYRTKHFTGIDFPCFYMGSRYNSGAVFSPDKHNCTSCSCNNGELRCNRQSCPILDCPNVVRGKCCNRCPDDCVFDMKIRRNGDNFSPKNDPCKTCYCSAGLVTCTDAPCPLLDCPVESQFLPPGQCCAECLIVKKTLSKSSRNIKGCRHRGILYDIGDSWVDSGDNCTVCECQDRESVDCFDLECLTDLCDNGPCERFGDLTCRVKPCQNDDCDVRIGKRQFSYRHGDIFTLPNDPCVQCTCARGAMSCFASECISSCSHGVKNLTECCSLCKDLIQPYKEEKESSLDLEISFINSTNKYLQKFK